MVKIKSHAEKSIVSLGFLCAFGANANAQSSVTLYGVIDQSIQYASHANANNKNFIGLGGGNLSGNRWGLRGIEDLGGGRSAVFRLESGFSPSNGSLGQGGRMFGRQAYVGLADEHLGTLTLGRQYDPLVDMIQPLTSDYLWGSPFTTPGDLDNNDNSTRTNNSVKYVSPVTSGLRFEAFYGLGGVPGAAGSGQTWSLAASYATGPFSLAAGYVVYNNANSAAARANAWGSTATSDGNFGSQINSQFASAKARKIASFAAQYAAGPVTAGLRYSNVQYTPDAFSSFSSTQRYDIGAGVLDYRVAPAVILGIGYVYMHGSGNRSQTYHQISAGADYSLSKRTELYLVGAYQHAGGDGVFAAVADYGFNSASRSQAVVSLGIRHKF
ncbi:porin [Burkholderia sp. 22PA0099]|uniref:porin n=1 Tax=Burkholderia sp. 22PA0099 TaxID=3237372 RepID=UPI0039C01E72